MGVTTLAIIGFGFIDEGVSERPLASRELEEKYPEIVVGFHCSDDLMLPYVSLKRCHSIAFRRMPKTFNSDYFSKPTQEEVYLLKKISKLIGIENNSEPTWFLASYLG